MSAGAFDATTAPDHHQPAGAACLPSQAEIGDRLGQIRERIRQVAPRAEDVTIVAVTKGFPASIAERAVGAGLVELGENYAQELLAKAPGVPAGVRWHFLGSLQRRRTRALAAHVAVWEAMDRRVAVDAVADAQPAAEVFVQVNVTGDPAKQGCALSETPDVVAHCHRRGVHVRGLMGVGPVGDAVLSRRTFSRLAGLAGDLGLDELSMGMSDDYEIAVSEGATTVRLGRALFGPRPSRPEARR
jgi:pyridoxal phosphate enzyme (YggS family)